MERKTKITAAGAIVAIGVLGGASWALAGGADGAIGGDDDTAITGEALDRASKAALAHTGGGRVTDTEARDEDSYYEVEVTLDDGSEVDVHLDEHFNVVGDDVDGPNDRDDTDDRNDGPITGEALDRASEAALAHTGGGRVTDTEARDEDGYYEVEVTRDDGTEVDVHLDEHFNVVSDDVDGADEVDDD